MRTNKDESNMRVALDWWNGLPVQNLEDPSDGWSGYCMKYYPDKTSCVGLGDDEILHIWEQEHMQVELSCMVCDESFMGKEPMACCSGRDCGCMGLPVNPVVCSDECYHRLPMFWKKPENELPGMNVVVEVSYDGGRTWTDDTWYTDRRICMMAGTAGGHGYFGGGWATNHNSQTDVGLICDPPDYWRYIKQKAV